MTFEEFQASKREVPDLSVLEVEGLSGPGIIYADGCYIEKADDTWPAAARALGRYQLTIENSSEISDDLELFERELWDWAFGEGADW